MLSAQEALAKRQAIRSLCAFSKTLYPDRNWLSVQHLLKSAWAKNPSADKWTWASVESEMQVRWENSRTLCGHLSIAAG